MPRLLFRYCRWALAVTVACLPLYVVRFRIGPLPSTLLEVLVLLTAALYVAAKLEERSPASIVRTNTSLQRPESGDSPDYRGFPRTPIEIPTTLFLLAAIIGVAVSFNHAGALGFFRAYFLEPVVVFYIAIDLLRRERDLQLIAGAFVAGASVFAGLNLIVWANTLIRHQPIFSTDAPSALYSSPNEVALFLEPAVAIAGGIALFATNPTHRRLAIAALVFLLPSLVLTLSRGGWLTLAFLILFAVVTVPRRSMKAALLAGGVAGALLVSRLPYAEMRLAHQLDPDSPNNTFEGRVQIWSDTLRMLQDHPLFGAGLRAYQETVAPYVRNVRGAQLYPHDIWLAMWSEIGVLGLAAFIAIMAILLWRGWRGFSQAEGIVKGLLWGTSAALIAIVVHGTFDTPYFKNDLSLEFWIVAALEVAALRIMAPPRATGQPGSLR